MQTDPIIISFGKYSIRRDLYTDGRVTIIGPGSSYYGIGSPNFSPEEIDKLLGEFIKSKETETTQPQNGE